MTSFRLALLNITRRKTPSAIAIVSIALSVACGGILLRLNLVAESRFARLGRGFDAVVGAKAGGIDILLGALGGEGPEPGFLPYKLFESLRSEQTVRFEDGVQTRPSFLKTVSPFLFFAETKNGRVAGTDETFVAATGLKLAEGRWAGGPDEVVLGSLAAEMNPARVGDSIEVTVRAGSRSTGRKITLKIVGIFSPTASAWDSLTYSNVETAQRALGSVDLTDVSIWGPNVLNYFLIHLNPGGFEGLSSLINRRTVGQAILVSEQKERLANLSGTGAEIGVLVTGLVLILGALAVTSMLLTRFEAMSTQIAVLRAIGYHRSQIARWLLWEGLLFGIAACCLGLILDFALFPVVRSLLGEALPSPEIVPSSIFQSAPIWVIAILSTTASVFLPLYRIYRQNIHFSLRT